MQSKSSDSGLYAYGLEDWLPVNVHTPLCVTDTIMCRSIADTAEKCFSAIGMDQEAQYAASLSKEIKQAFRKEILRPHEYDGPLGANDTVATHAMAIYYGMYEEEELPSAIYKLKCRIKQTGGHIDFGALCNRVFWRVVGEHIGMDEALDMMLSETYPSFAALLKNGMTTLWEGWGIGNGGFGGGSYNHAWSGGPLTILSSYVAGVKVVEPGFKVFSVSPNLGNLSHVKVMVPLAGGRFIEVDVKKDAKRCVLELTVPEGTSGVINLPDGYTQMSVNGKSARPGMQLETGVWKVEFFEGV